MNKIFLAFVAIIALIVVVVGINGLFTVRQNQQALILQFGNPVRVVRDPGLNVKIPFIQNVDYYDKRILDLDPPAQEVILSDQKRVNVDAFVRYRIVDPLQYRKRAGTDTNFLEIFGRRLNSNIRAEIAKILLGDMLTEKRSDVMQIITNAMIDNADEFGVEVIDVRIGRTDLPPDTAESVYRRMRTDREAHAAEIRAFGEQQKVTITSGADKERTVILSVARKKAELLRGGGDSKRNLILIESQNLDPEFFAFLRSLEAYGQSFEQDTTWVMDQGSDFFHYLNRFPALREGAGK